MVNTTRRARWVAAAACKAETPSAVHVRDEQRRRDGAALVPV
jgi:hypothetical protein